MITLIDYNRKNSFNAYNIAVSNAKKSKKNSFSLSFKVRFFMALAVLVFMLFSASSIYAEKYVMGGKSGWKDITIRNGITTGNGRYGYESLVLNTNYRKPNPFTDLLIDFEDGCIRDITGKYEVRENILLNSENAIMGKECGLSRGKSTGLIMKGNSESFFSSQGPAGSFLFDFWLCPSIVENGEVILNWRSSRNINGTITYQIITFSFYQNRLVCSFTNIFDGYTANSGEVVLYGSKKLVPQKWAQHSISFEESSGELSYKLNGELEDIAFITDTGHEGDTIYHSYLGKPAEVEICPQYTGLIDDFSVSRSFIDIAAEVAEEKVNALNPSVYSTSCGRIESAPILTKFGSILRSIDVDAQIPDQADVQFYVRGGDTYYNWTNDSPEWKPVKSGEPIENVSGLYFQVAADLFPDGAGSVSPSISSIALNYDVLPDPQPPHRLSAQKGDGYVTLTWSYSVDDTAGGYYIFYGNRPGEYLGRIAIEGESPLNAGNATDYKITGLNNGTIYYFAVAAYSKYDSNVCGALSREVYARPGR